MERARMEGISRRQMLGATAAGLFGAVAFAGCKKEEPEPTPAPADTTVSLEVYDPTGSMAISQLFTPRLDTLEGKTIGFVSDDLWEDARTFPVIKEYLEKTYHCTVIDQYNFPQGVEALTAANNGIPEMLKEHGCDAAIVGNAG